MICVFVSIYGYYSWTQLAVEAYPDIADTSSQVVTQAPGMAAEEVEQRITIPLERELNGTPGLLFMRSKSTFGLSLITLVFRDGIENYWSRLRINANSSNAGGSVVARGDLGFVIRAIGFVQSLDDLGAIVVTQRNGTPIFLRDLGRLKLANLERHGIVGKNRQNDVIEGTVLLLKDDNPSRVLEGIHAKVAELNERLAAHDVQIVPYYDRSDLVGQTVSKVSHTIFHGIALVLIVLILFLGSPRSALLVGITIPFAMVTVFVLMNFFKISANLLSLGAIDFGIIVDAAIVVTAPLLRLPDANPDERLTQENATL